MVMNFHFYAILSTEHNGFESCFSGNMKYCYQTLDSAHINMQTFSTSFFEEANEQ